MPPMVRADPVAAKYWRQLVPDLTRRGLVNSLDTVAVSLYVMAFAALTRAEADIAANGTVLVGPRGGTKPNPSIRVATQARQSVMAMGRELGLTPAARIRLRIPHKAPEPEPESAFDRWLNMPSGRASQPNPRDALRALEQ